MQPALEDLVHAAVLEALVGIEGHLVAGIALLIERLQTGQCQVDPLIAEHQRARHFLAQDEELGDQPWPVVAVAVEPAVGAVRRDRAQDLCPLLHVEIAAHVGGLGQEDEVLHVEDARRVVGALDEVSDLAEIVGVVAQHGAEQGATERHHPLLDPLQELRQAVGRKACGLDLRQLVPGRVDALPHVAGDRGTHGAGIVARGADGGLDARRIALVEDQEVDHVLCGDVVMQALVGEVAGRTLQRRTPFVAVAFHGAGHQRDSVTDLEEARHVLGALHVARHPEQGGCRPAEHQSSSTQVSLVPPPWLEFTTSEPFFSATRVRPPGVIRT